jgi:hypothetical protein
MSSFDDKTFLKNLYIGQHNLLSSALDPDPGILLYPSRMVIVRLNFAESESHEIFSLKVLNSNRDRYSF